MQKILVSVCVPVYGVEKYIEKCLRSLFEQTARDKCEFIIVNDCTPDNSIKIARSVASEYPELKSRIHIVSHKVNMGLPSARNTALDHAKGKYILCVDSDDWCEKNYVEELLNAAEEKEAQFVACDYYKEDYRQKKAPVVRHVKVYEDKQKTYTKIIQDVIPAYLWIKMFRRDIFEKNNLKWIPGLDALEDFSILARYMFFVERIAYVPKPLYHYRSNVPTSIIHRGTKKNYEQMIQSLASVQEFLMEQGVDNIYQEIIQARILAIKLVKLEAKGEKKSSEKKAGTSRTKKTNTSLNVFNRNQKFTFNSYTTGVCYYPEHWDKSLWHQDLQRMKAAGISVIRIAEFAWNKFEPEEGNFTYSFFDSFLDVAEKQKMKVIFCTPTATPPAWLTEKYPEVLNCRIDGIQYQHGMRRHYNYNSKKYLELSARIVEKIASHYAGRKCIIGWQIDNEMNCETDVFYSKADDTAFRKYLKTKYKTIEALNKSWGTVFWNQTYNDWSQVHLPRVTIHNSTNPHQVLDYYRFISNSTIAFCRMQSDIIRKYKKENDFITTNGIFSHIDNHWMQDSCLDIYMYDSYPNFAFGMDKSHEQFRENSSELNDRMWSRNLSEVRSVCSHFGIMEQQSGAHGWNTRMEAPAPKPGQINLWAMQSVAHGADYVSFFRWRTSAMGTEIYWHGILDWDNADNRKLSEITGFSSRLQKINEICGADFKANVAILKDYDNIFDSSIDVWHNRLAWQSEVEIFAACQLSHTPMDYLYFVKGEKLEDLLKYNVIFMPHSMILTEENTELLEQYVKAGGHLVFGAATGQKNSTGQCVMKKMPGLLQSIAGACVKEQTFVGPADERVLFEWNGNKYDSGVFNEILEADSGIDGVNVLGNYCNNYYAGEPALVETKCQKGSVIQFGGTFTRKFVKEILLYTKTASPWSHELCLPEQCELVVREKGSSKYFFILNYSNCKQEVKLLHDFMNVESLQIEKGSLELEPYGVLVLKA